MFEDGSLVKHKKTGYEGLIDGRTNMKMLFTGNRAGSATLHRRIKKTLGARGVI